MLIDTIPEPNIYTDFINKLKLEQEQPSYKKKADTLYETHHIIPLSHNGPDIEENTIDITFTEHKQAHRIIADLSGNIEDKQAADMMSGKKDEDLLRSQRQKAAYISHISQRKEGKGRFSSTFQSERGKLSAAAPSSISFSNEKAVALGRLSKKNKEFPFETRFTLSRKSVPVFCIQNCWSSKDILNVIARAEQVLTQ